ncbi:MAG: FAD:protein FMN transferase [Anaerolineales bacterium]
MGTAMDTFLFRAMNTDIILAAEGDSSHVQAGFEKAKGYIEASERRFTRFSEDSELSHLNRSAGSWFHASADMTFVVSLAKQYVEQTGGLFDPSILPNLERIGYDRSMDLIRAEGALLPPTRFIGSSHPLTGSGQGLLPLDGLFINPDKNLIFLPLGMRLDLGGIAKGWIAEQAAMVLAEYSRTCLVDAGGDMFMLGLPEGESSWQIELEDPLNTDQSLTSLNVPPGAVTTSSVVKRKWMQGETSRHHLIDPRTGAPAETDWLSVTVVAPHADMAEVFAKALLIAGPQEAEIVAHNAPEISYLAVDRGGKIWGPLESLELING